MCESLSSRANEIEIWQKRTAVAVRLWSKQRRVIKFVAKVKRKLMIGCLVKNSILFMNLFSGCVKERLNLIGLLCRAIILR
ncbi:MAG: hypothetical protein CMA72_00790 [Euryarchaeota archaeon]|nr:hypothetical protein [Euryarchaeota archaeon]